MVGRRDSLSPVGDGDIRGTSTAKGSRKKNAHPAGSTLQEKTRDYLACRYEMKYRISEAKATAIEQFIKPYIPIDHYSRLHPHGAYPIVSLYLDSNDLKLCRQTLRGQKNRFKLRIRSYSDEPDAPYFFEIKRRLNGIIIKSRVRVARDDLQTLLLGTGIPHQKYKTDEHILGQFQFYKHSINAKPVARIRYDRKAYEDDSDNRVRVTFDRNLCYNIGGSPIVSFNSRGWQRVELRQVILEIKFTALYPIWLSQMVKCFDLRRQSMSKYAASIKHSCSKGFCAPVLSI